MTHESGRGATRKANGRSWLAASGAMSSPTVRPRALAWPVMRRIARSGSRLVS